ncbi:hypothetical protein ANN_20187 [Periplaneta americana]|uniref:Uncharacterized protein n=1 Tax=Periplaneta americana TaxID=6978 RepID=A0ABQ8SCD5_PERAM|nr:hypothetical protein ANN_20187 [Periplaneta americana]
MSPGSNTESYPAFARIGLKENPGKTLNQTARFDAICRRLQCLEWFKRHCPSVEECSAAREVGMSLAFQEAFPISRLRVLFGDVSLE